MHIPETGGADANQPPDRARSVRVPILTRVEGEGGLLVRIDGDVVRDVELSIYEPPRLFEALLRGRSFAEVADITARICGICPIAYQMTAVQAIENAMQIEIAPAIKNLRRLLYCGEWIESHALHIHLLHAPDFFGCASGIELARRFPEEVKRGLQLKKTGNRLLEILGGRAIHPINVAVGGFYRVPRREELRELIPDFEHCLQAAIETAKWVAGFPLPDFDVDYDSVAMVHDADYPITQGDIASTDGTRLTANDYEKHFVEEQVPHSTAFHSLRLPTRATYLVGPLARLRLNVDRLSPAARETASQIGWSTPGSNPYGTIVARALEVVHAFEEGLNHLREYTPPAQPHAKFQVVAGEGSSTTEAPRGLLYHRYQIDSAGRIELAKIVPPTSQNQAQIESDIRRLLPSILRADDRTIAWECEKLVRSYDPCISCSTHFLKVRIEGRSSTHGVGPTHGVGLTHRSGPTHDVGPT